MEIVFKALSDKIDKMLRNIHLDGQRTDDTEQSKKDLNKVIALETQEMIGNIAKIKPWVWWAVKYQIGLILGIWD